MGSHATAAATTPLHEVACRYLGIGSVVGVTCLATAGSTPVHMPCEDGGTGPGGDRSSGLDSFYGYDGLYQIKERRNRSAGPMESP